MTADEAAGVSSDWSAGAPGSDGGGPQQAAATAAAVVADRPEIAVGAAFVGGLLMARIIRRLGR